MKKMLSLFLLIMMILSVPVFADVDMEEIDFLFFGEVTEYNEDRGTVIFIPREPIFLGSSALSGDESERGNISQPVGFVPQVGQIYLFVIWNDGERPITLFETTSREDQSIELLHIEGNEEWKNLQDAIQSGIFETEDAIRAEREAVWGEGIEARPEPIMAVLDENERSVVVYLVAGVLALVCVAYVVKRKRKMD